jgi:hypothetical protein
MSRKHLATYVSNDFFFLCTMRGSCIIKRVTTKGLSTDIHVLLFTCRISFVLSQTFVSLIIDFKKFI